MGAAQNTARPSSKQRRAVKSGAPLKRAGLRARRKKRRAVISSLKGEGLASYGWRLRTLGMRDCTKL